VSKRRKPYNLLKFEHFVGRFLQSVPQSREAREQWIPYLWHQLVGPEIAALTRQVTVSNGIVRVSVESSALAQELSFKAEELKRKLNKRLRAELVVQVRFSSARPRHSKAKKQEKKSLDVSSIELDETTLNQLKAEVDTYDLDEDLKQTMLNCLVTWAKLERRKQELGYRRCPVCQVLYEGEEPLCPLCRRLVEQP